ncbi:hypothetical protein [Pseudomonas sp. EA_15y_Pfl1_P101]|uniref:hypothetical protein n=1 Tax=Pseudomonas sp. EA_15y_Pfl1_P101 TaxID=3088684 RepID=UPI0030DAC212
MTGTNVDFAASSRNGDSFVGPDGATYEVANVASATVISILPAYKGPTVSGAAYAIMPVQGYDKLLSDAFNALVNQFGAKLAALGTTGNYDILPLGKGGTGGTNQITARDSLGLGAVAVENVLPLNKGGTGGSTQALARNGLGLSNSAIAPIIGAVSQSGGAPTGALMEYVSSANGEAWKFACGLMICTRSRSYGLVIGDFTIYGSIWYYYGNWTFPVFFAAPPVVTGGARGAGRVNGLNADANTTVSACNFFVIDYTSPAATTVSEKLVAIGRWF